MKKPTRDDLETWGLVGGIFGSGALAGKLTGWLWQRRRRRRKSLWPWLRPRRRIFVLKVKKSRR